MRALLIVAVAALGAGCGGTEPARDSDGNVVTVEQIARVAGFVGPEADGSWTGPGGCRVNTILLTHDQIEDAHFEKLPVVTNSAGTMGVTFPGAPECRDLLKDALSIVG